MNSNVLSVIIYGSHARKDHDDASDLDVCVLTADQVSSEVVKPIILHLIPQQHQSSAEITTYPCETTESMLNYGSLFMWHLKTEGKIVYGERYFNKIIKKLSEYKHHKEELLYHYQILNDIKKSQKLLNEPNEFDLSILFTICRNTCMILSNKFNSQKFGRISCFHAALNLFKDIPLIEETYLYLSDWKNLYERNYHTQHTHTLPTNEKLRKLIENTESLLIFALEKIPNDN